MDKKYKQNGKEEGKRIITIKEKKYTAKGKENIKKG